MYALSIRQPWAYFITQGLKTIENRKQKTNIRGTILIHTGLEFDKEFDFEHWAKVIGMPAADLHDICHKLYRGGIVGTADIVDCVTKHDSPWFFGPHGYVLARAKPLGMLLPCKGQLGFFRPPEEILQQFKVELRK